MAPFIPISGMQMGNIMYPSSAPPMVPQRKICAILSFSNPGTNILSWDLRDPPTSATTTANPGNAVVDMNSSAIIPDTNHITITCRADVVKKMWPDIQVAESPVTVECVLRTIHDHFQRKVTEEEYRAIQDSVNSQKYLSLVDKARNERSRLLIQKKESICRVPLRRVDFLGGKHNFGGLEIEYSSDGSYSVVLHLA